jgi:hypothetical protein
MKTLKYYSFAVLTFLSLACLESCDEENIVTKIHSINTAEKVSVDRFSTTAGHLMIRDSYNGLPASNAAVNFDQDPFITKGLGPSGQVVEYYNFDIQPTKPAPIYVLFKEGDSSPVQGQLNIIDVLPGETGYNDFWQVFKVTVPTDYEANGIASLDEIQAAGFDVEATTTLVNCPVVPEGSTATKRLGGGSTGLVMGWYKEKIVHYFTFDEQAINTLRGNVPTSPIYVCFNVNADEISGGPSSGFKQETGTLQTHNVVATLPASPNYSPLWVVNAYDNAEFNNVIDLLTAQSAMAIDLGAAVNCPIVTIQ